MVDDTNITKLSELYESEVKERVDRAVEGKANPILSIRYKESDTTGIIPYRDGYCPDILDLRPRAFGHMFYDRISAVDSSVVDTVASSVQSRGLYEALISYKGGVSEEQFLKRFQDGSKGMKILDYIYPLVILDLVQNHPEIVEDLSTLSLSNPGRHFQKEKQPKTTIKDLEKILAPGVLELIPEELSKLFPEVIKYIGQAKKLKPRLGEYELMDRSGVAGSSQRVMGYGFLPEVTDDPERKKEAIESLDKLFSDVDLRRDLYNSIRQVSDAIYESSKSSDFDPRNMSPKFSFRVSPKEYHYMLRLTKNFALNQLLCSFNKSNGERVFETYLSRRYGLKPSIVDDSSFDVFDPYLNSKTKFKKDQDFLPTVRGLPFIVYLLNRHKENASRILREN